MNVGFDFNTPPIDNVAYIMAKKPELHFDYDEIKFEAHQRAFTVAKVTQIDLLAELQASLENAFVEGQSFESWRKNLKPTLQKHGWLGQTSVINPKTGEEKEIFVGAKRLKTIFYTNARTAYAQAEARAGYELKLSEYIRYVAILDNRVRAEHAALHGKIAHRNDDFWKTNYPPNGWNCRCSVEFISKDEMDELGWTEMSDIEKSLNYAEKGWDKDTRNLKKDDNYLQKIINDKLEALAKNKSAKEALSALKAEIAAQRQRYMDICELWAKGQGTDSDIVKMGKVGEFVKDILKKKGYPLNADEMILSWNTINAHRAGGSGRANTHSEIGAFEYSLIPFMFERGAVLGIFKDANGIDKEISIVVSKLNFQFRLALRDKKNFVKISSLTSNEKTGDNIYQQMKDNVDKLNVWTKD